MSIVKKSAAAAAPTYYGGVQPSAVTNEEAFLTHDTTTTWDDDGAGQSIMAQLDACVAELRASLQAHGGSQVKLGVVDYTKDAYLDFYAQGGKVFGSLDFSNNAVTYRTAYDMGAGLLAAMRQAQAADDQGFLQAASTFAGQIMSVAAQIPATARPRVPNRAQPTPGMVSGGFPPVRR